MTTTKYIALNVTFDVVFTKLIMMEVLIKLYY